MTGCKAALKICKGAVFQGCCRLQTGRDENLILTDHIFLIEFSPTFERCYYRAALFAYKRSLRSACIYNIIFHTFAPNF